MTMSEANTIDIVAHNKETGKLLLVMTEHRTWDNVSKMHKQLFRKANTYVQFALSENFKENFPGFSPADVVIKLDCACEPGKDTLIYFQQIQKGLQKYGMGFEFEVCS